MTSNMSFTPREAKYLSRVSQEKKPFMESWTMVFIVLALTLLVTIHYIFFTVDIIPKVHAEEPQLQGFSDKEIDEFYTGETNEMCKKILKI